MITNIDLSIQDINIIENNVHVPLKCIENIIYENNHLSNFNIPENLLNNDNIITNIHIKDINMIDNNIPMSIYCNENIEIINTYEIPINY